MVSIRSAKYLGGYRIQLQFDTGEEGVVDLGDVFAKYPAARQLEDCVEFARFSLDEWPTLVWPCGFDLSPEALYERATGKRPAWHGESVHEEPSGYRP